MNPLIIEVVVAVLPIARDLAVKLVQAIKADDLSSLTPEDWIALLRLKQKTSEERLLEILRKHQPNG